MIDALIKELDGALSALFAVLDAEQIQSDPYLKVIAAKNRLNEALSALGDAEREELANYLEEFVSDQSQSLENDIWIDEEKGNRIVEILRRPVAPVVTDEMVERVAIAMHAHGLLQLDAPFNKTDPTTSWEKSQIPAYKQDLRDRARAALSQPAGGGK